MPEEHMYVLNAGKLIEESREYLASDVTETAKERVDGIQSIVERCVKENEGKLEGLEFRLKGLGSTEEKIVMEAGDDRAYDDFLDPSAIKRDEGLDFLDSEANKDWSKENIRDSVRFTSVSATDHYKDHIDGTLKSLENEGCHIIKETNYWGSHEGYRGVNVQFVDKNGQSFEIQFHTSQSLEAKEFNHPLYEQRKAENNPEKRKELTAEMEKTYAMVEIPPGMPGHDHPQDPPGPGRGQ